MTLQCQRVLDYMRQNGSITRTESSIYLSCTNLPGRIYDLKAEGIDIIDRMETGVNQFGEKCTFKRYMLKEA